MAAPFRADHVGSLLRPGELHQMREQARKNEASFGKLKEAEDRAIREVVRLQEEIGLPAITDGEFRRDFWHVDFLAGFDGIELRREGSEHFDTRFKGGDPKPPTMVVTGKLRRTKPSMVSHFTFLR
jgi:5-methyltetrahydropteroyltriglutamate--homocysteine methyltransferase